MRKYQGTMPFSSLHWADYVVFTGFFGLSLLIGAYHAFTGGRQRSVSEFIMANRKLSVIPTMVSLVMSFLSALTILGGTAEMYSYGMSYYCWYFIGLWIGIVVIERLIVPWLFPMKLTSVFEVGFIICAYSWCDNAPVLMSTD